MVSECPESKLEQVSDLTSRGILVPLVPLPKWPLPIGFTPLTNVRLLLPSFFGSRWRSFARVVWSFDRLTRPRSTMVTNFFIVARPSLSAPPPLVIFTRMHWHTKHSAGARSSKQSPAEGERLAVRAPREGQSEERSVRERNTEKKGEVRQRAPLLNEDPRGRAGDSSSYDTLLMRVGGLGQRQTASGANPIRASTLKQ